MAALAGIKGSSTLPMPVVGKDSSGHTSFQEHSFVLTAALKHGCRYVGRNIRERNAHRKRYFSDDKNTMASQSALQGMLHLASRLQSASELLGFLK